MTVATRGSVKDSPQCDKAVLRGALRFWCPGTIEQRNNCHVSLNILSVFLHVWINAFSWNEKFLITSWYALSNSINFARCKKTKNGYYCQCSNLLLDSFLFRGDRLEPRIFTQFNIIFLRVSCIFILSCLHYCHIRAFGIPPDSHTSSVCGLFWTLCLQTVITSLLGSSRRS